jgi:hypothetical protein
MMAKLYADMSSALDWRVRIISSLENIWVYYEKNIKSQDFYPFFLFFVYNASSVLWMRN